MPDILPSSQLEQTSSTIERPLCVVCNNKQSIYTCPRCKTRTCSLPCSAAHKKTTGCSGERNKAAYVPPNKYGWGTMMDDYVFLEDLGRKVGEWGMDIVKGGYSMRGKAMAVHRRGDQGRGRGRGRNSGRGSKTKRDVLKMQLEARDIEMEVLPVGMERRKMNQSTWDSKNHTAMLSIEFKFYSSSDPQNGDAFRIMTHKNSLNSTLLSILQAHVDERDKSKREDACPEWVKALVLPDPYDPDSFKPPDCVMKAATDPVMAMSSKNKKNSSYYRFDPTKALSELLQNAQFVEFPTIEVWEEFKGLVVDMQGSVTQFQSEEGREAKRRKLSVKAGKKAINGLLGDYGSASESEGNKPNVLSMLGGYVDSEDENAEKNQYTTQVDNADPTLLCGSEDEDEADVPELDPATLLELMRRAQGDEKWAEIVQDDDGDDSDWGPE